MRDPSALRLAALSLIALSLAPAARAQVGTSVTVMSDYRYRGFSLSDQKPALSVALSYDHPSGFYAEVTGVLAPTADRKPRALGYQLYAGYAHQLDSGASLDVGVTGTNLTEYFTPSYRVRYAELYGGVSMRHLSAHLYYSPDYLGEGVQTVYASLDATANPRPDLRLFAHAGALAPVRRSRDSDIHGTQYDLSAGAALRIKAVELKAALSNFGPSADYPANHRQSRSALVVSAAYAF